MINEKALIFEIRTLLLKTLAEIEAQQVQNRTLKQKMEFDWSDKKKTHQNESVNCNLSNKSMTILFKPGATRFAQE